MKMSRTTGFVAVLACALLVGCGSEEEPPSCQQALSHYYNAGCSYFDLSSGQPIPAGDMIAVCREGLSQSTGSRCDDAIEAWLFCMDSAPTPAAGNSDCDCSREQERLATDC